MCKCLLLASFILPVSLWRSTILHFKWSNSQQFSVRGGWMHCWFSCAVSHGLTFLYRVPWDINPREQDLTKRRSEWSQKQKFVRKYCLKEQPQLPTVIFLVLNKVVLFIDSSAISTALIQTSAWAAKRLLVLRAAWDNFSLKHNYVIIYSININVYTFILSPSTGIYLIWWNTTDDFLKNLQAVNFFKISQSDFSKRTL